LGTKKERNGVEIMEYMFRIKNLTIDWNSMDTTIDEYNMKDNFHNGLVKIIDNEVWNTDSKDDELYPMSWIGNTNNTDTILDDFCGYDWSGKLYRDYGLCVEDGEVVIEDEWEN